MTDQERARVQAVIEAARARNAAELNRATLRGRTIAQAAGAACAVLRAGPVQWDRDLLVDVASVLLVAAAVESGLSVREAFAEVENLVSDARAQMDVIEATGQLPVRA